MKTAIFPGTFDPFTIGHYDIVLRGLDLFDNIVIGIGQNCTKQALFSIEERLSSIQKIFAHQPRVKVVTYDGLTIDLAKEHNATFILRGVRSVLDFEYERNLAETNKRIGNIETILLYSKPEYGHISSTLIRDLHQHGYDTTKYLP
jgi:pantetheine-phosphate adenylyltransferase